MGTVYHGAHPMQVWSTVYVVLYKLGVMVHAVCSQGELQVWVFRGLLLMPMLCMMRCRVSLPESSILLNARPAWGKSPFHREAVCKFAVCKEYSESVFSPPKRESCLEKCKSLNCGRACMWGLLVELNINKLSTYQ